MGLYNRGTGIAHIGSPTDAYGPSELDSLYLGEALEAILFEDDVPGLADSALVERFEAQLSEVRERSSSVNLESWTHEYSTKLKKEGKIADTSGLSPEKLGDKWFV